MKTIACIAAIMLSAMSLPAQIFRLHGKVHGAPEGTVVRIMDYDQKDESLIDSVVIRNGEFHYTAGKAWKHPKYIGLDFFTADKKDENRKRTSFFADSHPMTFECPFDEIPSYFWNPKAKPYRPIIQGAVTEKAYDGYRRYISPSNMEVSRTSNEYYSLLETGETDMQKIMACIRRMHQAKKRKLEKEYEYICAHPSSVISLLVFSRMMYNAPGIMTGSEIERLYRSLSPSLQDADAMAKVRKYKKMGQDLAKGCHYHDASLVNTREETVKLSDYVKPGMYNMLEFWASWCGPCRGEIPHLKRIYGLSKGKDFNIVSISIDRKQEDWLKAVREENMEWNQLRCCEGWKSEIARKYYVNGVPFSVLLDPQGNIVSTNARGMELDLFLNDYVGIRIR